MATKCSFSIHKRVLPELRKPSGQRPGRRISDRFADAAQSCSTLPALGQILAEAASELGFQFFALIDHSARCTDQAGEVRLDNYPPSWVDELVEKDLLHKDPVHLASTRTNIGFCWSSLSSLVHLGRAQHWILERSRSHGIETGFTIPSNVPGEPPASCS